MNRAFVSAAAGLFAVGIGVMAACSGNDGGDGAAGPAGSAGTNGGTGMVGTVGTAGPPGATTIVEAGAPITVVLTERAKAGLDVTPVPVNLTGLTPAQIEQVGIGAYLVYMAGCTGCHNSTDATPKFLAGGVGFSSNTIYARNLTPDATTGLKLSAADFVTAMRTGADFAQLDGGAPAHTLGVMPWTDYRWMSTPDLLSIYAYLRAIPPVTNAVPADAAKTNAAPLPFPTTFIDGQTPNVPIPAEFDATNSPIPDPDFVLRGLAIVPPTATITFASAGEQAQYGRGSYLVNAVARCNSCHGNPARSAGKINFAKYLNGGTIFVTPAALRPTNKETRMLSADLVGGASTGFFAQTDVDFGTFLTTIQQGVHGDDPPADGGKRPALGYQMPADHYRHMTLDDLGGLYTFLKLLATQAPSTAKIVPDLARYCTAATVATDCEAGETCNEDATVGNECVGAPCVDANDCNACQTCDGTNHCIAPAAASTCLTGGIP